MLDALQTSPAWLIGVCTLLGLCVGSFLNVVIYRLPLILQREWVSEAREILSEVGEGLSRRFRVRPPARAAKAARPGPWKAKRWAEGREGEARLSLMYPPSRCPSCGSGITALQNIPVVSWLVLRGRCANCRTPISARYPVVELASGVIAGFLAWRYGYSLALAGALLFAWALIALALIDFDTQYLPDVITLPLLWLGLLINLQSTFATPKASLLGAVGGYLILWSVFWGFKLIAKKEGMGYGDFKLLAAIGAWVGWQVLPFVILVSAGLGSVVGIAAVLLKGNSTDTRMPFGPYLALGGVVALVWGRPITTYWLGYWPS